MYSIAYTKNMRFTGFLIAMLFLSIISRTQHTQQILSTGEQLVNYSSKVYGSDDMLVNGRIYVPQHSLAEGHPYFNVEEWVESQVFIKGHMFDGVKLKFDIELDEFILFTENNGQKNYIVLNKHYVDSVYMGKYLFVNTTTLKQINEDIGYAELVLNQDILFLVKYKKDFKKEYSETKPYGEYNRQNSYRYLGENNNLVKLNTKKALLEYFKDEKRDIKRYMKKNNIKYKKANSGELFNLISFCNNARKK